MVWGGGVREGVMGAAVDSAAALRIQRGWRRSAAAFEVRWRLLERRHHETVQRRLQAALLVQRRWRGCVGRRRAAALREDILAASACAATTAAAAAASSPPSRSRSWMRMRSGIDRAAVAAAADAEAEAAAEEAAVVVIQCAYRSHNARFNHDWRCRRRVEARLSQAQAEDMLTCTAAAGLLQRLGRGAAVRAVAAALRRVRCMEVRVDASAHASQCRAAVTVQSCWRRYHAGVYARVERLRQALLYGAKLPAREITVAGLVEARGGVEVHSPESPRGGEAAAEEEEGGSQP